MKYDYIKVLPNERLANQAEDRAKQFDPDAYGTLDGNTNEYTIHAELRPKDAKRIGFQMAPSLKDRILGVIESRCDSADVKGTPEGMAEEILGLMRSV